MNNVIIGFVAVLTSFTVLHSGKTDSTGGHFNHSTGEYHYHHGYSAHAHYDMNGDGIVDCPYTFKDKTSNKGNTSKSKNKTNNFSESSNNGVKKQSSTTTFGDVICKIILFAIYSYVAFFSILGIVFLVISVIIELAKKRNKKVSDFLNSDKFQKPSTVVVAIISIVSVLAIMLR